MKSFGDRECVKRKKKRDDEELALSLEIPPHPPQLINTDYQKRMIEYEMALQRALQEIDKRDKLIADLSESTNSVDISLVKQILGEDKMERLQKLKEREERLQRMEEEYKKDDEKEKEEDEKFKQLLESQKALEEETRRTNEILEEQYHSLGVIQQEVGMFDDVLKKTMEKNQREPNYLRPTKLTEKRIQDIKDKKKEKGRWH